MDIMKRIFDKIDKHNDLLIPRKEFVEKIKKNKVIRKNLDKPGCYIANIDKTLTLRILLHCIVREADRENKESGWEHETMQ
jgi:hypothetical protein